MSGSTLAGRNLGFCDWEEGRKGQEWGAIKGDFIVF